MKKIIAFLLLAAAFLTASCGSTDAHSAFKEAPPLSTGNGANGSYDDYWYLEGYYLLSSNGSHMIVGDNQGPCVMSAADGVSFDGLTDGDRIKITTSVILESYPGQLTAHFVEKFSDGERSDIDEQTLKQLAELGWIE